MKHRTNNPFALAIFFALLAIQTLLVPASLEASSEDPPDILFVILDDVGIDQLTLFGNGGAEPPSTPNIDAIAAEGLRFTNAWATPECSPSRSAFFTGRWGIRTGVTTALIPNMLPQAQVSPYEVTLPRLLRTAGYTSAMMGKYHLGNNNPSGSCSPATRGFDFFRGNMEAGPPAIDSTAGLDSVAPGTFDCGFVRSEDDSRSAITGACYYPEQSCQDGLNGKQCLETGGVLVADSQCQAETPDFVNFDRSNGYYVWPETINDGSQPAPTGCTTAGVGCAEISCPIDPASEPGLTRDYMSESQTDSGIEWWYEQDGPRMLTVSYNSIHTPYQQPPTGSGNGLLDTRQCQGDAATRFGDTFPLINAMFSSADREIAILLQELGLATLDALGGIEQLLLDENNTMLVIVGDNGSFAPSVRLPYDPTRAKGSVFQTGVLVPLIVAGPLVAGEGGRESADMVNVVDLYQLFAEIAGINARSTVPPAHRLDSVSMMQYLEGSDLPPARHFNYAEVSGDGTLPTPVDPTNRLWPCVILGSASQDEEGNAQVSGGFCNDFLFDTEAFCQTNGGIWFGPGTDYPNPHAALPDNPDGAWGSCCAVHQAFANPDDAFLLAPASQKAVHNEHYKLVELTLTNCNAPVDDPKVFPPFERIKAHQFYDLDVAPVDYLATEVCHLVDNLHEAAGNPLRCNDGQRSAELPNGNACANAPECLAPFPELFQGFGALQSQLNAVVQSATQCPGDGNQDMRVTQLDIDGVMNFMGTGPSYYDFNQDGQTDEADLKIASDHLGTDCLGACRRADLDGDNIVTRDDALLLKSQYGLCDGDLTADPGLCAGDINGNGRIGRLDFQEVKKMQRQMDGQPCPITVQGQGDPAVDADAIQNAIDLAALDPDGGRVILQGEFDMGGCSACVQVHGPVLLEGAADPSGQDVPSDPLTAIIANAGIAPIIVNDNSAGDGIIRISKLWFKGGQGLALDVVALKGRIELLNNRISGYRSFSFNGADHRFGLAAAGIAMGSAEPSDAAPGGEFLAQSNHIDNRDVDFEVGDDNGISLLRCRFSRIDILDNVVYSRGESIELESCANPGAIVSIAGNDIISDAAVSVRAPLTASAFLEQPGGHPAALKVAAAEAASLTLSGNQIRMSGEPTAVCIMPGLVNPGGTTLIENNHCSLQGQFAALLGGWAGTPGLFGPFYLQNATIRNNTFTGTAYLGMAFVDFTFSGVNPGGEFNLINQASGNHISNNSMTGLVTSRAALLFGEHTSNNTFSGNPNGLVEDHGSGNQVNP